MEQEICPISLPLRTRFTPFKVARSKGRVERCHFWKRAADGGPGRCGRPPAGGGAPGRQRAGALNSLKVSRRCGLPAVRLPTGPEPGRSLARSGTSRRRWSVRPAGVKPRPRGGGGEAGRGLAQPLLAGAWAPGCGRGHRLALEGLPTLAGPGPASESRSHLPGVTPLQMEKLRPGRARISQGSRWKIRGLGRCLRVPHWCPN